MPHRSSSQEVFYKKDFLKKTHRKYLRPASLLKKRLRQWCFPVNFMKFLRTPHFIEHLRLLLVDLD